VSGGINISGTARPALGATTDQRIEQLARYTPLLILLYFAAQFIIRVALSANLETDESELVGRATYSFDTGNGHPPLYNWLVAALHPLTGGHWAATLALVKNGLLGGSYILAFDLMRRIIGRALPGFMVVCAFLLIPQIVWKSQITLTHSVLVMFAAIAMLHAIVLIVQRGSIAPFAWLGLAMAIGGLAKYNFFIFAFGVLVAAATVPPIASKFCRPMLGLSAAIFALLFGPFAVWSLTHWADVTQRLEKLENTGKSVTGLDIPFLGLDGILTLATGAVAWVGPLIVAWFAVRHFAKLGATRAQHEPLVESFSVFFARTMILSLAAFATIVLLGDLHATQERYLTPLLIALPFWLALAYPLEGRSRGSSDFVRISGTIALAMLTAWPAWALLGREQLFFPYEKIAKSLDEALPAGSTVLISRAKYVANLQLHLTKIRLLSSAEEAPDDIILVWDSGKKESPERLRQALGSEYRAAGPTVELRHVYMNYSGSEAVLTYQRYRKSGEYFRALSGN
jgi:4-amino-4-deoxy-L-arabinose transferase-like glycosyltransferase